MDDDEDCELCEPGFSSEPLQELEPSISKEPVVNESAGGEYTEIVVVLKVVVVTVVVVVIDVVVVVGFDGGDSGNSCGVDGEGGV